MTDLIQKPKNRFQGLTAPRNQRVITKQDSNLQVLTLIDATASMTGYLDSMKDHARSVLNRLARRYPGLGMCSGFYRDHDCVNAFDFFGPDASTQGTFVDKDGLPLLQKFLSDRGFTEGNSTTVEAMGAALFHASQLPWIAKTRVVIHAGDQPSHGYMAANGIPFSEHDTLDNCPLGMSHKRILDCLKGAGTRCYMIRCGISEAAERQYQAIAKATGGRYIDFADVKNTRDLMVALEASLIDATGGNASKFIERSCRTKAIGAPTVRALLDSFQKEG